MYPDAFFSYIQTRQLAPFFQAGRVADGIVATTELIASRVQEAEAGRALALAMAAEHGRRRGADRRRRNGRRSGAAVQAADARDRCDGSAPLVIVQAYLGAMAARDARHDLPFYSASTRLMLRNWIATPAHMDNLARAYRNCRTDGVR